MSTLEQVSNVLEIFSKLQGVEYGWMDIDKNIYKDSEKGFKKKYVLSSPDEVLDNKVGTCIDLVELERAYFKNLNLDAKELSECLWHPTTRHAHA